MAFLKIFFFSTGIFWKILLHPWVRNSCSKQTAEQKVPLRCTECKIIPNRSFATVTEFFDVFENTCFTSMGT
jgi:hypothetical protein